MVFSSSSDAAGIVEDIDFLVNTNSTSYPIAQKTRNINRHYDDVVTAILQSDARWKWDDTNNASEPTATITMTGGTNAVSIPDTTYLTINRVEVLDVSGVWYQLVPIEEKEIFQALPEFQKTDGRPIYYQKVGNVANLYPAPTSSAVTLSNGLRVYFQRGASYFASTDTTKVPGFAAPFHRILSYGAALDYAIANSMNGKISMLMPLMQAMKVDLMTFYATRERDKRVQLKTRREDYGSNSSSAGFYNGYNDKVAF